MKIRNLYLLIITAVIVIFIMIYSNSKVTQLETLEVKEIQTEKEQALEIVETPVNLSLPLKQIITVIKPAEKREKVLPEASKVEEIIVAPSYVPPAEKSNAVPGQDANNISTEEEITAGITLVGKYPAPEKAREMNSKGIVMY